MVENYRVKLAELNDNLPFLRLATLDIGGNSLADFNRAVCKKFTNSFISSVYLRHVKNSIYEVPLELDLDLLRLIDGDEEQRKKLIYSKLPPTIIERSGSFGRLIPIIFMTVEFNRGDSFTDEDIEFILDILTWPSNALFVAPTIRFGDEIERTDRIKIYDDFVTRLLRSKNQISSNIKVAGFLPSFYPRPSVPKIFDLYEDENVAPDLFVIDFKGERLTSPSVIGKINRIMSHFGAKKEENYYIYGFNVKPFKKGEEGPNAEDVASFTYGLNAIGDKYRMKPIKFRPSPMNTLADAPRVFANDIYKYRRLNEDRIIADFSSWVSENMNAMVQDGDFLKKAPVYTKLYNLDKIGEEAVKLSTLVRTHDDREIKDYIANKEIVNLLREDRQD
jgi:hypothetical protein